MTLPLHPIKKLHKYVYDIALHNVIQIPLLLYATEIATKKLYNNKKGRHLRRRLSLLQLIKTLKQQF